MQPQSLLPSLPRNVSNAVLRKAICRRIESMNSLGPIRTPKEATCGAKTRSGSPCQKPPLQGKTRCRLHGGKSLSGKDHPNYKHGHCTKETRRLTADGNAYIKYLKTVLIELGLIEMTRKQVNTVFGRFFIHLFTAFRQPGIPPIQQTNIIVKI